MTTQKIKTKSVNERLFGIQSNLLHKNNKSEIDDNFIFYLEGWMYRNKLREQKKIE